MAEINRVSLPDGTAYDLEDSTARQAIADAVTMNFATVATSGSYNDLTNKPTIPTVPTISTNISADANSDTKTASPKAVKTYVDNNIPTIPVTDVTVGGSSVVSTNGVAIIPAIPTGGVSDVKIKDGTSIVTNGIANLPLPPISAADDGKVLVADNGSWTATTLSTGIAGVGVNEIKVMTKAQYDALDPKVLTTLYIVTE